MSDAQTAVDALESLGLTPYEARCFVALSQLSHGTAREVARVADVPRSRVYETMERLGERGLVEIQHAEPLIYRSASVETAVSILSTQYETYVETVDQALRQLQPARTEAERAVWAINTHDGVTGRVVDLIRESTDEIVLIVLDDRLLDAQLLGELTAADDDGVTVYIGAVADGIRTRIDEADIEATLFTTDLVEWLSATADSPRLGRLLMVDREPVLVSALHAERLPSIPNETAVWSDGLNHGFATFAERVLTYELEADSDVTFDASASDGEAASDDEATSDDEVTIDGEPTSDDE